MFPKHILLQEIFNLYGLKAKKRSSFSESEISHTVEEVYRKCYTRSQNRRHRLSGPVPDYAGRSRCFITFGAGHGEAVEILEAEQAIHGSGRSG